MADLNKREQHYMDSLKPVYNTLKIAGNSFGYRHTEESKDKRSKSLKGVYIGKNLLYMEKLIHKRPKNL